MNNVTEFSNAFEPTDEKIYEKITLEEIIDELCGAENVLILTHVNPDGDCIGSAFALRDICRAMGKQASVSCPGALPKRLKFLTRNTGDDAEYALFEPDGYNIAAFDKIISVDVASPMQLGSNDFLIPRIDFMIDHHGTGEAFTRNYIDPAASASGEIIYEIYDMMKNRALISTVPDAARKIYSAIVSDTGSFKFSNTTEKTHLTAARLLTEINSADDGGDDTADLCRSLFGQRTMRELTAQMLAIRNLRFYEDGHLAAVLFTQDMLRENGLCDDDIGNVVDTPRCVEGVLVGIAVKQLPDEQRMYKVSSRANAEIDCASVCAAYGGGGHVRAAGCTIEADSPEAALEMMARAFGEAVRGYGR